VNWFKEGLIHRTATGVMVRSKSEVIVADTLTRLGISYEYEKWVDGVEWSRLPDFTISVEGKVFYWEHLGMMWNETYANRWAEKLSWYKDHGYADKLIVSEEIKGNGPVGHIDSFAIDRLARERILGEVFT
jgi:exodeoxyribonuclease V alpha subunit